MISINKINRYPCKREGCFRCKVCGRWIQEGEMYLKVDDYNICEECEKIHTEIAEYDDGYADYIDREVHERIENIHGR